MISDFDKTENCFMLTLHERKHKKNYLDGVRLPTATLCRPVQIYDKKEIHHRIPNYY